MKKKIKDIKFEDHLKHAKEIVEKLESGDCSLDEMLNLYEQGVNSLKICSKQLSEFEGKIKIIKKDVKKNIKFDDLK